MALIVAGIDEAGYGPLLGPLCVAMAVFRVEEWTPGDPRPDLWQDLRRAVARTSAEAKGRLPVADSKRLKLPSSSKTRHPLTHLETGVLSFLTTAPASDGLPETDDALLTALGAKLEPHPWYDGPPTPLPLSGSADSLAIHANALAGTMRAAGVELLALRCVAVGESAFNQTIREHGTKARTTLDGVGRHLRSLLRFLDDAGHADTPLRVVCDRLGGRTGYGPFLSWALADGRPAPVEVLEESARASRYQLPGASWQHCQGGQDGQGGGGAGDRRIVFMPEAEEAHLPVALASMTAKLVRELAMLRFNRYWSARQPDLKPTAGYRQDARRWLEDAAGILAPQDREAMIRLA